MDFGFIERFVSDCKSDIVRDVSILHKYLISYGTCIFLTVSLSLAPISDQLYFWRRPREQKKILPIIIIPSIYGIASFVALNANEDSKTLFIVLDTIKECSVGLGLAMFLSLLYIYMGINTTEHSEADIRVKVGGRVICNVFPVTLFQPRYVLPNKNNLKFHKYWTWQFVVIRLVCSVFMIVLQVLDMYPVWLSLAFFSILSVSVSLAFYNLVAFYQAFIKDFTDCLDTSKLFFIKGIVFVCFLQGGVLKVIGAMGIFKTNHFWQQQVHNYLVTLEMPFFTAFLPMAWTSAPRYPTLQIWRTKFAVPKSALAELNTVACGLCGLIFKSLAR